MVLYEPPPSVFNQVPNSAFARELLMNLGVPDPLAATLGKQIDILVDHGVEQFALWTETDDNALGGPSDPTVTDYLRELFRPRGGSG